MASPSQIPLWSSYSDLLSKREELIPGHLFSGRQILNMGISPTWSLHFVHFFLRSVHSSRQERNIPAGTGIE